MSNILLDTLIDGLGDELREYLNNDPEIRKRSEAYIESLLVNEDLLSADAFTTTSSITKQADQKTLTEEIAELDEQERITGIKLAELTNNDRDLIIDVSENLKDINNIITTEMTQDVNAILKSLKTDEKLYEIKANDKYTVDLSVNSSILANIDSILDLLELPTLCKICILQGNYQEALEISVVSRNLIVRFPKIPAFAKIYDQIKLELNTMVKNLIKLLNTNLKQNNLIKIFNILSKLNLVNFNEKDIINSSNITERTRFLKMIYFNSRFKYIINELSTLNPLIKFNKFTYLKRFIEVYRSELYHCLSMFHTILNHSLNLETNEGEDKLLVNQFVKNLAVHLIKELKLYIPQIHQENDLNNEIIDKEVEFKNQMDGLILQIIYLCKSLSKFGENFENLLVWELCYSTDEPLISETQWLENLTKVKKLKA